MNSIVLLKHADNFDHESNSLSRRQIVQVISAVTPISSVFILVLMMMMKNQRTRYFGATKIAPNIFLHQIKFSLPQPFLTFPLMQCMSLCKASTDVYVDRPP